MTRQPKTLLDRVRAGPEIWICLSNMKLSVRGGMTASGRPPAIGRPIKEEEVGLSG
jgi:hypothetical protein